MHDKNNTVHDQRYINNVHQNKNGINYTNYHNNMQKNTSRNQQNAKYVAIQSVIDDCALRAMSLARQNAISAHNAAQLIILLYHLSYNNLDKVFSSVLSVVEKSVNVNVF